MKNPTYEFGQRVKVTNPFPEMKVFVGDVGVIHETEQPNTYGSPRVLVQFVGEIQPFHPLELSPVRERKVRTKK